MPLIINTNISALNAQRQLVKSGDEMSQAMERLSSGKRINTAADDAAGMAISSRMTSTIRGLNQAVRNANDGISLIQTAGGALEESTNILQRMRELSIQSANGIYTDANRISLDAEVNQLKQELTRIATTTSFNGLKILDGTLGDIALQIGTEANETITLKVGSGFDAESLGKENDAVATGVFTLAEVHSTASANNGTSGTLEKLIEGDLIINGVAIPAVDGGADSVSTSDNGASALSLADAINSVATKTGVFAEANSNSVTFDVATVATGALSNGDLTVNGVSISGTPSAATVDALVTLINNNSSQTGVIASVTGGTGSATGKITLTSAVAGANIQVASDATSSAFTSFGSNSAYNNTYTGTVTLRSNEAIEITGNKPADFGFSSGAVAGSTVSSPQDVSSATSATITVGAASGATSSTVKINGIDITWTSDTTASTNASNFVTQINAESEKTGVFATVSGADISLVGIKDIDLTLTTVAATTGALTVKNSSDGEFNSTGAALVQNTKVTIDDLTFTTMSNGDLTIGDVIVDFNGTATKFFDPTTPLDKSFSAGDASAQFTAYAINNTPGLTVEATAYTELNLGSVSGGTLSANFGLSINGVFVDLDGTISANDADGSLVAKLNTFFAAQATTSLADGLVASINDNKELIIAADDGRNITVSVAAGSSITDNANTTQTASVNSFDLFSNLDVGINSSVTAKGTVALKADPGTQVGTIGGARYALAGIENGSQTVNDIDISTQDGAQAAIAILDRSLDQINEARGDLGAANNRLDFTVSNLMNVAENTNTARSRIMDADFAAETSMLSRAQVLQQASQAMLAQANALPQQVLRLLQ